MRVPGFKDRTANALIARRDGIDPAQVGAAAQQCLRGTVGAFVIILGDIGRLDTDVRRDLRDLALEACQALGIGQMILEGR